jgi:hypothetical protein
MNAIISAVGALVGIYTTFASIVVRYILLYPGEPRRFSGIRVDF